MSEKTVFSLIQLAAGFSRRFGSNKLLHEWNGKPLFRHTLDTLKELQEKREDIVSVAVVTQYPEILFQCRELGILCRENLHSEEGISSSLKLGILASDDIVSEGPEADQETEEGRQVQRAYMFFVSDQPFLSAETIEKMLDCYREGEDSILCAFADKPGNPVIFHEKHREELLLLSGDVGGKQVMKRHPDEVKFFPVDPLELRDIDAETDLALLNGQEI